MQYEKRDVKGQGTVCKTDDAARHSVHTVLAEHLAWWTSAHITHPSSPVTHTHTSTEWVKRCRKWDAGLSLCNLPFPHLDVLTYFDWTFILHWNAAAVSLCHTHKLTHTQFPLTPSWEHFTLYIGRRYWKWRNTSSFKDAVCRHISFPLGLWVCFIFCKISRIKKALICRVLSGWGASLYAVYVLCTQLGKANK